MVFELISKEVFYVLLFLIPGYVGFLFFLTFLSSTFPAFRYRPENIGVVGSLMGSIVLSSLTFWILAETTEYSLLIDNLSIDELLKALLFSLGAASGLAFLVWGVILLLVTIWGAGLFFLNRQRITGLEYWDRKRWKRIWRSMNHKYFMVDGIYWAITEACEDRLFVRVKLKDGAELVGRIEKDDIYDISYLRIRGTDALHYVRLRDITRVSVLPKKTR